MNYTGRGYLRIKASSADSALPIEDAIVRVWGTDEENYGIEYMQTTDEDGLTDIFRLPAPPRPYSLVPNPKEAPYATYRAEIEKDGYESISIETLQIFDEIAGVLPINMVVSGASPYTNGENDIKNQLKG